MNFRKNFLRLLFFSFEFIVTKNSGSFEILFVIFLLFSGFLYRLFNFFISFIYFFVSFFLQILIQGWMSKQLFEIIYLTGRTDATTQSNRLIEAQIFQKKMQWKIAKGHV